MNKHPRESADTIRKFAKHYRHADVDFDRSGAEWLDSFIDWLRENEADICDEQRIFALGSFFGTCVIETIGGQWSFHDGSWRLFSASECDLAPFLSVRLHLQFGQRHSILGEFDKLVGHS